MKKAGKKGRWLERTAIEEADKHADLLGRSPTAEGKDAWAMERQVESTGGENEGATRIRGTAVEHPRGTAEVGAEGDRARAAEGESVGSIVKRPGRGKGVPQTMETASE